MIGSGRIGFLLRISGVLLSVGCAMNAQDGATVFQKVCSNCHRDDAPDAPSPSTLRSTPWQTILTALETGKMTTIGTTLSAADRTAVAKYLGTEGPEAIPQSAHCAGTAGPLSKTAASWNAGARDLTNSRFQTAQAAGITGQDVPRLKLKWAFGFPGVTTAFGTPTVYGGRVFIGSADGTVYSLNAQSGCIYWMYKANDGVRTAVIISSDGLTAWFGDLHAYVHAVNAETGKLLWKTHVEDHPQGAITGTPKLEGDRLYVPVSGGEEEVAAGNPAFVCCKFRGNMVALDARTGKQIWKSYTIAEPAKMTGKSPAGTEIWGPAGVSIWSSPTVDPVRGALYFGTGVNYTQPATKTSDAVLSFDMKSGRMLWAQQLISGDAFNFGCVTEKKLNCPDKPGKDLDIGAPPMLKSLSGGRRILIVGTKAGIVFGLDPDKKGNVLWQTRISEGGSQGGVIWGSSSDDKSAYFSISDWNPANGEAGGGMAAVDIATGKKIWSTPAAKPACLAARGCSVAQPGATTLIPGAVVAGSLDGHLRAYDTADGHLIWDFDTLQDFQTVNGVKARGGAIDGAGTTIAEGMLYANAGYSRFPVMAGNVFLAFSLDGK
jgi:polyvinyl alcohol dehydrogenase (cytochrome)